MSPKTMILSAIITAVIGFISGTHLLPPKYQSYQLDYRRIAINIPLTHKEQKTDIHNALGEKYLAESLARAFNQQSYQAVVNTQEDTLAERTSLSGYEFYLRAYPELAHKNYHELLSSDRISILYETFPYNLAEVKKVDIIFTGSEKRSNTYRAMGLNSYFIPQFTSIEDFYPAYDADKATDVLYVANQWPDKAPRITVQYALKTNTKIDIYGKNWQDILKGEARKLLKGEQIPNKELKYYYSSAKIVLNDMRPDMVEAGFINNRIFDVSACKAFQISAYSPAIKEIYGDSIPMYSTPEEFQQLISYYLAHPEERHQKAEIAYQITISRFTRDKVAEKMLKLMENYRRHKQEGEHHAQ